MPLGIREQETDEFATVLFLDLVKIDFVEVEIFFESLKVIGEEGHFGQKVRRKGNGSFFELNSLAAREEHELSRSRIAIFAGAARIDEF